MRNTPLLVMSAALTLSGCATDDPTSDLKDYIEETQSRQRPHIEPLPEVKPYQTFLYGAVADGYRSPFSPSDGDSGLALPRQSIGTGSGPQPDPNRRKEALEEYPLDALRMQGTLNLAGDHWGIVSAPDGSVRRVKVDNYLGLNHGQIKQITDDGIQVMELVPNGSGGWQWREAGLALAQE